MKIMQSKKNVLVVIIALGGLMLFGSILLVANYLTKENINLTPTFAPALIDSRQVNNNMLIVSVLPSNITIEMVLVPEGKFSMGSTNEPPIHDVYLDAFWIDRTEVTNAQFAVFIQETGYQTTAEQVGSSVVIGQESSEANGVNWQYPKGIRSDIESLPDYPVTHVSWYDAVAFCAWRHARLPTEAEWEKAARGSNGYLYPWGDQFDGTKANFCDINCPKRWKNETFDDGYADIAPVGNYANGISSYGVFDMAGNVAEWIADWFTDEYYSSSPIRNPSGPTKDDLSETNFTGHMVAEIKVIRGGSWEDEGSSVVADVRDANFPDYRNNALGFRCVSLP